jgi:hypothetical protein
MRIRAINKKTKEIYNFVQVNFYTDGSKSFTAGKSNYNTEGSTEDYYLELYDVEKNTWIRI